MKHSSLLIALVLAASRLLAVPADQQPITVRQPDGSQLTLRGHGDERYNVTETADGYTVVRNGGWWEYATLDGAGAFVTSGIRAANDGSGIARMVRQKIAQHLREASTVADAKRRSRDDQYLGAIDLTLPARGKAVNRVLVLLVRYPDMDTTQSSVSFQQMINQDGWHSGSMSQYYQETSYGQLSLNADYRPWIRSSQNMAYYAYSNANFSYHVKQLVREAVDSAEANGVNFALYDNDNNGTVDGLFIVHVGQGAEEGGNTDYIWSHSSSLSYAGLSVVYDGKTINPYIIMPETYNGNHVEIGVFCHEYGHGLGLPDLYDTDGSSEGVGNYCLMGAGSWGGNGSSPQLPVHMSPWCKKQKGWLTFDTIKVNTIDRTLPPVETTSMALKVWKNGTPGNQYFFVENRRKLGFDAYLPNTGLLIWHIDESVSNNNNELRKKVDVECATGLVYGGGTKDYLDTTASGWPRVNGGDYWGPATGKRAFDPFSNPSSKDYSNALTMAAVYNIVQAGGDSLKMDVFVGGSNLSLSGTRLNDAAGDNDGIPDEGETVGLAVTLSNTAGWVNATGVTARLSTADTSVQVTDSLAVFPNITAGASGTCSADSFIFYVRPGLFPHKVTFVLTKSCAQGSYDRVDTIEVAVGAPRVLLVDDDNGSVFELYYQASLDTNNILYRPWSVAGQGSPTLDSLSAYPIVVWYTGNDSLTTMVGDDTTNLKAYLNGGGKLFLSSKQLGQQIGSSGFYQDMLKLLYVGNNAAQVGVRGVPGDAIGGGLADTMLLSGAAGAGNYSSSDKILPQPGADSCFAYRYGAGIAAVKYAGAYKVVYFGFPFEAIAGTAGRHRSKTEIMGRIMDWFGGVMPAGVEDGSWTSHPAPLPLTLWQNSPNPFNAATAIRYQLSQPARVRLAVYNALGQRVRTLADGVLGAGVHVTDWNGTGQSGQRLPNGVYFFQLDVAGQRTAVRKAMLLR